MSDPIAPTIMLCHQPDLFPAVVQRDIDLTLAGHHHGGQVKLRFLGMDVSPVHLVSEFVEGLYVQANRSYMSAVASEFTGPPVRPQCSARNHPPPPNVTFHARMVAACPVP